MTSLLAKAELKSLTNFQKEMHVLKEDNEEIISIFYKKFVKSTWYSSIPCKLKASNDGDVIIYEVNTSFHYLFYTYLKYKLPYIKVKDTYKGKVRVRWTHNVGNAKLIIASFLENDDNYHTIDNVWCDIHSQFFQKPGAGKRKAHNIGVGNVSCLQNWTDFLPEYPINTEQPWFYGMDHSSAFPIFYKNSQTRAQHRYLFRKNVLDLLMVEVLNREGQWVEKLKKVSRYLDIGDLTSFKKPELWGRYAFVTDQEITYHKCDKERVFYTRDVEICDTPNATTYGKKSRIPLECENPCLAFFWVAENQKAIKKKLYSNYTTNADDLYSGWDPIKTTSLKYGSVARLNDMESDHFNIAESRNHFLSSPSEIGYHGYSYAWDSTCTNNADIGIVLGNMKASLYCKIANNNIFINNHKNKEEPDDLETDDLDNIKNQEEEEDLTKNQEDENINLDNPTFITKARLLVIRKFTVKNIAKPGEENFLFSIE